MSSLETPFRRQERELLEQIVEQFEALRGTGIGGVQLSFFDFEPDLAHFGEKVLPLMWQAGQRLA